MQMYCILLYCTELSLSVGVPDWCTCVTQGIIIKGDIILINLAASRHGDVCASGSRNPRILNLGLKMTVNSQHHVWDTLPRGKEPLLPHGYEAECIPENEYGCEEYIPCRCR